MTYEIAISFADPDKTFVVDLNEELGHFGIDSFMYLERQGDVSGGALDHFLSKLFGRDVHFALIVVSRHYVDRFWPIFEKEIALKRGEDFLANRIVLVRRDDTAIPELTNPLVEFDARKITTKEIAVQIFDAVDRFRASSPLYNDRHHGNQRNASPVHVEIANEIMKKWHTKRSSYFDNFLNYDIDFLVNFYHEKLLAQDIPYTEIVNWLDEIALRSPISTKVEVQNGQFAFKNDDGDLNRIRQASLSARKKKNVGNQSEFSVGLQGFDATEKSFLIQRATYHDQARSNLNLDYTDEQNSTSMRDLLARKYGSRLPSLGSGYLADTVGVAVLIFYRDGNRFFPYLVPRSKGAPVFSGGWHCSASGAAQWPQHISSKPNFDSVFLHDLYSEIREEIGLFRSSDEKRQYMENDPDYRNYQTFVSNLDGEDFVSIVPVAFCRELLRGGKPQLFFIGITSLDRSELMRRRLMASKISANQGRREEIDSRLINIMPDFSLTKEIDYDQWISKIHETGITLEVLPLLHYASKISFDHLVGAQ